MPNFILFYFEKTVVQYLFTICYNKIYIKADLIRFIYKDLTENLGHVKELNYMFFKKKKLKVKSF